MSRLYRVASAVTGATIESITSGDKLVVRIGDREITVDEYEIGERYVTVTIGGRSRRFLHARESAHVHVAGGGQSIGLIPADEDADDSTTAGSFTPHITAPMPGKVLDVLVAVGDRLEAGAPLLLLEAMKMEQTIRSATAAEVVEVHVAIDAMVGPGETLVTLAQLADE